MYVPLLTDKINSIIIIANLSFNKNSYLHSRLCLALRKDLLCIRKSSLEVNTQYSAIIKRAGALRLLKERSNINLAKKLRKRWHPAWASLCAANSPC